MTYSFAKELDEVTEKINKSIKFRKKTVVLPLDVWVMVATQLNYYMKLIKSAEKLEEEGGVDESNP